MAAGAEARPVVGALITDTHGRVFVQRRSEDRRLFPGCWDVVGGAVEEGEGRYEALRREIEEETGWSLRRILAELAREHWTHGGVEHVETDYLVEVDGDLTAPRLERDKHTDFAWVGAGELALLDENTWRTGSTFIKDLVSAAHRQLAVMAEVRAAD
ncbi:NUDIX domain-containing protein [Streptomyces sp. PU-14G]|uniref:NUDIX domain-containing protein n=1 Tax=Streptomyces sp. PU-14G TaxID=2800808 RepID=UPI0034DE0C6B